MEDCIFCKIVRGEIPSKRVYEDDRFLAFFDIEPQAKTHILVIPKVHIADALVCGEEDAALLSALLQTALKVAKENGLDAKGFRLITNVGEDARQSVKHLHFHLLGGELLSARMA